MRDLVLLIAAGVGACTSLDRQPNNETAQSYYDAASQGSTWILAFSGETNPVGCPPMIAERTATVPSGAAGQCANDSECAWGALSVCETGSTCWFALQLEQPDPDAYDSTYLLDYGYGEQFADNSTLNCIDSNNDVAEIDPASGIATCDLADPSLGPNDCEYTMQYTRQ